MTLFILMGILSGIIVSVLSSGMESRRAIVMTTVLLPLCTIGIYLMQGHPDIPAAMAITDSASSARFQVMRLAEKPVERLEQTGGQDAGALSVMGDLNLRLNNAGGAEKFYRRALKQAEKDGDPRAKIYRDKIDSIREGIISAP